MERKKAVFISAYCQNGYQEDRIKKFVENKGFTIINTSFNVKGSNPLENKLGKISLKEANLISKSDEVWISIGALDSNQPENKVKMSYIEESSMDLNKPVKYIYIYQSGLSVGKTKSITRGDIFDRAFYAFLHRSKNK
jgi:predicted small secreted protein